MRRAACVQLEGMSRERLIEIIRKQDEIILRQGMERDALREECRNMETLLEEQEQLIKKMKRKSEQQKKNRNVDMARAAMAGARLVGAV